MLNSFMDIYYIAVLFSTGLELVKDKHRTWTTTYCMYFPQCLLQTNYIKIVHSTYIQFESLSEVQYTNSTNRLPIDRNHIQTINSIDICCLIMPYTAIHTTHLFCYMQFSVNMYTVTRSTGELCTSYYIQRQHRQIQDIQHVQNI